MGQDDSAIHGKHLPPSPRRQPNKSSLKLSRNPPAAPAVPIKTTASPAQDVDTSRSHPDPQPRPPGPQPGHRFSCSPLLSHQVTHTYSYPAPVSQSNHSPTPASRSRTISDPQGASEPPQAQNQTASTSILRRKVLSKETMKLYNEKSLQRQGNKSHNEDHGCSQRNSQAAVQVPWEKEVSKEGLLGFGLCLGQSKGSGAAVGQDQGLLEEIESMCCLSSVLPSSLQLSQVHCSNSRHQVQGKATDKSTST